VPDLVLAGLDYLHGAPALLRDNHVDSRGGAVSFPICGEYPAFSRGVTMRVRFGECLLDSDTRHLFLRQRERTCSPKLPRTP
jgi:hypothetical protein